MKGNERLALFLFNLAGAVALLLWAVRLVRTGVERGYSVEMRRWLRRSSDSKVISLGSGLVASLLMQSSTAVAMLMAGFVSAGTLGASVGLSVLLGADVGSALVAKLLLLSPTWVIPALLVSGVTLFLKGNQKNTRQVGRILIGLALIFVALGMIRTTTAPVQETQGLKAILVYLGNDPFTAFVIGAVFTWAAHSSVAAVLLVVTLASHGSLPPSGAMALVLGANLGGAMIAFALTSGSSASARQVVLGNVLLRGGGAVLVLTAITSLQPDLSWLGRTAGQQAINLHIAFNLMIAIVGQLLAGPVLSLAARIIPAPTEAAPDFARVSALDDTLLNKPDQALAAATREILRIGEDVEVMLDNVIRLFKAWDEATADQIASYERRVDTMHFKTKVFLARLQGAGIGEDAAQSGMDLTNISVNLEAAGDLIARNLVGLSRKMHTERLRFSDQGLSELCDFHDRVLSNAQLALNVLLTADPDAARQLVEEKEQVRTVEVDLQSRHIDRLRANKADSLATSNIHQETLRSLKQINTAFTMIAYPILSESGDLLASRLAEAPIGK